MMRRLYLLLLLIVCARAAFASHLIGGELNYLYLGNNKYLITLKIFRNCNSGTPYDPLVYVRVFDQTGHSVTSIPMKFPGAVKIPPDLSDPCLVPPPNICVQEAMYQDTVILPPRPGGYTLTYQRCCRTESIVNIAYSGSVGATYTCAIPDTTGFGFNSNPYFKNYPPIDICVDGELSVDQSAIDPDGDSLAYSLCTPLSSPYNVTADSSDIRPPPYDSIFWKPPFNVHNQFGGNPFLAINSKTGLITGFPTAIGQYVVGICVKEYRKGKYLTTHSRDFQFNVAACDSAVIAKLSAENAINNASDTLLLCGSHTVQFVNLSKDQVSDYVWNFGDPSTLHDTSSLENPAYTYPDTGFYRIMLVASPLFECADTAFRYVNIRDSIISGFQFGNVCLGDSMHLINLSRSENGAITSYDWNFGDEDSSEVVSPAHLYSFPKDYIVQLKVVDLYGCTATSAHDVRVFNLPNPSAGPDTTICQANAIYLHASNGVSYHWSPDFAISDTSSPRPLVSPGKSFTYYVFVIDSNGCKGIDSARITINDTLSTMAFGDTTICQGASVQLNAINANQYTWTPSTGLSNPFASDPVATPQSTIVYVVSGIVDNCVSKDSIKVQVLPFPQIIIIPDTTIDAGQSVQLFASGGTNYSWFPGTGLSDTTIANPLATPTASITYYVKVGNQLGCSETDSVTISVNDNETVNIPTAFTPNGDGINDLFSFHMVGIQQLISTDVFDRWGKNVFHTTSENDFWDGTYGGQPLPIGNYAYKVVVQTISGKMLVFYGSVVLIR